MKRKKIIIFLMAGFALLLLSQSPLAYATSYDLNNWNVAELDTGGDKVVVTVGSDSTKNTTLTVQWFSGDAAPPTGIGIDKFGFNSSSTTIIGCAEGWTCDAKVPKTMDGFGSFLHFEKDPGGTDGISEPIVFTLSGNVSFTTTNDNGATFAAHVRYSNNCSGFVSDGTTTSISSDIHCSPVPEPSTLLLLGSGLACLGLLGRRIYKKGSRG